MAKRNVKLALGPLWSLLSREQQRGIEVREMQKLQSPGLLSLRVAPYGGYVSSLGPVLTDHRPAEP